MAYSYSNLDNKLKNWFKNDDTCASLHNIQLKGRIRSLKDIDIAFEYPISVIAGKNGCGKTTILALAACAYHNNAKAFKMKSKKGSYYTFSDFFIQTQEEIKHDGIAVEYQFLHNNWKGHHPGLGLQRMIKRSGGKWSKYDKRIKKNVLYLGIERVVPQTEKQVYKTYIKYFTDSIDDGWYQDVQKYVGRILGKSYSDFKIKKAGGYNLQLVTETKITYSGFNMGAGERALFELFSIIHECSKSTGQSLIIIDEIELGLHEVAQRKLIEILKEICQKHRIQIICTTHAPAIIDSLPPEARFYVEKLGEETIVTKGISGDFAAGRLSDQNSNELDIYVEDGLAVSLLSSTFNLDIRQRVGLIPVGSFTAVCRQLGASYKHPKLKEKSIAILDGDQRSELQNLINRIALDLELSTAVEKTKFRDWVKDKILFLPGNENPEKWIIRKSLTYIDKVFADLLGVKVALLRQEMGVSLTQPTHEEFYYLANKFTLKEDSIINDLSRLVAKNDTVDLKKITSIIEGLLNKG